MKRRIALLRSLSRTADAVEAVVELLEASPTDIEAWTELSDLYISQGFFPQAEFCLEEVLLVAPNAWNVCYLAAHCPCYSTRSTCATDFVCRSDTCSPW